MHKENDDRWATKTSGAWNYFVPSFSRPYPSVSRPTSDCYKERKNARYAGWACHYDDSFGSFSSFVKKVLFTSRPLQIQIEKNLIELFLQQIVKWSPQALKNWYKLYLQILHVNEVFTNGNFFCATSETHPSHNTFMSKEPIFKFSNDNHSQLTILKYQQLQTNVFPKKLSWGTNPSPRRE